MKIKRDAFLYLPPLSPKGKHAQCETCVLFVPNKQRCGILGSTRVTKDMSCGLYIHGIPHDQTVRSLYLPEEVGLVDREVRCENCKFGGEKCGLYEKLNKELPDIFDLDERIEPKSCCNANTPK